MGSQDSPDFICTELPTREKVPWAGRCGFWAFAGGWGHDDRLASGVWKLEALNPEPIKLHMGELN